MKKVLSFFVCVYFEAFALDVANNTPRSITNDMNDFIQINDEEYVQHHSETSVFSEDIDIGFFTPTRVFTRKGGVPSDFRDIKKIKYTNSGVAFYRDPHGNQCYIDISHPDPDVKYKCRVFGFNGRDVSVGSKNFSVYSVLGEYGSFKEKKSRLIYVNNDGLFIVSEAENPLVNVASKCLSGEKYSFVGEVVKISAIDGVRTVNDLEISEEHFVDLEDKKTFSPKNIFILNCAAKEKPVFPKQFSVSDDNWSLQNMSRKWCSKIRSWWTMVYDFVSEWSEKIHKSKSEQVDKVDLATSSSTKKTR